MKIFLKNQIKKKQYLLLAVDGLIVSSVLVFAYILRIVVYEGGSITSLGEKLSWVILIATFLHLLSFYIFELYKIGIKRPNANLFLLITISVLLAVGLIAIVSYALPQQRLGRIILAVHVPLLIVFIFLWRKLFFVVFLKKAPQNNLLLVGSNSSDYIINLLKEYPMIHYNLIGAISDYKGNPGSINLNGVVYEQELDRFVKEKNVKTIVIAEKLKNQPTLNEQLIYLKFKGTEIYDFPTFYKKLTAKIPVFHTGVNWFLFSQQDKYFNPNTYLKLKRLIDMTFAVVILVLSAPLFLIIAFAIKLTSKGPVFFKQQRLGLNEKPFTLIKFRTMVDEAEKDTGPMWSSSHDPRITRAGKFLRKTRLDELPQLLNILKGDMSFVGPRPIRKYFADQLSVKFPYYRFRFSVKPGVTGWAQVRGDYAGSEHGQLEKLEYELFYIQNRSIFLDMFIILKTVQTILFRRGK